MLKRFIAIALIFSTLGLLARFSVPYLWYYSNYHYIASELCINRHNPDSDCNGSCQLKKMIGHQAEDHNAHEGKTTLPNDIRPIISLYYQQSLSFSITETPAAQTLSLYQDLLKTQFIKVPRTPPPISLV